MNLCLMKGYRTADDSVREITRQETFDSDECTDLANSFKNSKIVQAAQDFNSVAKFNKNNGIDKLKIKI